MSLSSIIILVLIAAIILAVIFTFFHILIVMLPAILLVIVGIWIAGWFSRRKYKKSIRIKNNFSWSRNETKFDLHSDRKKARNVTTKDIDN